MVLEPLSKGKGRLLLSEAINNGGKQQDQGSNNTMVDGVAAEISFSDAGTEETV